MSYKIRVDESVEHRNKYSSNVLGPQQEELIHHQDRFTGIALDTTNNWATAVPGTSDTIAISETAGGSVLMTTGTGDNDSCMLSSAIIYNGSTNSICEFRITITDVSGTGLFVGFSDAKSEANNSIAIHYPSDSLTTVATDAAGFVIDADHATSSIMCASVDTNVDTTPVDTGVDWADGETKNLRVILDTSGVATFVLDGDVVARIASSVTPATLLCATVQAINREAAANTVRVHQFDAWADRT